MSDIGQQAKALADRPYSIVGFRDKATDGSYIYVAINPELNGCMAQGETLKEAQENLAEFRVDYIEHLLEHKIAVPNPAWQVTKTQDNSISIPLENSMQSGQSSLDKILQSGEHEQMFTASLISPEDNLISQG